MRLLSCSFALYCLALARLKSESSDERGVANPCILGKNILGILTYSKTSTQPAAAAYRHIIQP